MSQRYFLTDDSGAPIDIKSLHIHSEDYAAHSWTYDTKQEAIDALVAEAGLIKGGQIMSRFKLFFYIRIVIIVFSLGILAILALMGLDRLAQVHEQIVCPDKTMRSDYDSRSEYDDTEVGERE